jgi:hypothetical protein
MAQAEVGGGAAFNIAANKVSLDVFSERRGAYFDI